MTKSSKNKVINNFKWLFTISIIIGLNGLLRGQNELTDTLQLNDSINKVDEEFNFIMLDFSYTNNKLNSGGQTTQSIPAYLTDFSFIHKTGLYTGLMLSNYSGADTLSYDIDIQAGYQKYFFNDFVDIDINYTFHKYEGETAYEGIKHNHELNASAGLTYKIAYLFCNGNFYLDDKNYFTDFGLNITADFDHVFFKNDFIFIQPGFSFTFGTDYWLYDTYLPYIEDVLIPGLRRRYPALNLTKEQLIEKDFNNKGISLNTYSYQGFDFMIPVTFGINNVSLMFSWMYYIPSEKLREFSMRDQSGYFVTLSFIF